MSGGTWRGEGETGDSLGGLALTTRNAGTMRTMTPRKVRVLKHNAGLCAFVEIWEVSRYHWSSAPPPPPLELRVNPGSTDQLKIRPVEEENRIFNSILLESVGETRMREEEGWRRRA
jgi:hypothetical protein